jgi:hypothetical protein
MRRKKNNNKKNKNKAQNMNWIQAAVKVRLRDCECTHQGWTNGDILVFNVLLTVHIGDVIT